MSNKRILFIDLDFHKGTGSSNFFVNILKSFGDVEIRHEAFTYGGNSPSDKAFVDDALEFDLVVCWQVIDPAVAIARMGHKNILWVPMMDSNPRGNYIEDLKSHKVLCFSSTLYYQLQRDGFKNLFYAKYYPEPKETKLTFNEINPYFWQRSSVPTWRDVCKSLSRTRHGTFNIHWRPDDRDIKLPHPSHVEKGRHGIRVTEWFETKQEAEDNLEKSNLYFAPRYTEGIGMSFLDAMAMGMPVVSFDSPTANEYITSGYNGILMDSVEINRPISGLTVDTVRRMSDNTVRFMKVGHEQWRYDKESIITWLIS